MFAAIDAGCAGPMRVNPGNIKKFDDKVGEIARALEGAGIPIRIGVNAGSLDKRVLTIFKPPPGAGEFQPSGECSLFEEHDFRDIRIIVKRDDPLVMVRAYELLAAQCQLPTGTSAAPKPSQAIQGTIKSAVAFGALLSRGIGGTIPHSPSPPRQSKSDKVGTQILE